MSDARKRRPITATQWLAARAISEGAPSTRNRVAAMLGCDVSAVYARAATEGWRCADFRRPGTRGAWEHFMEVAFGEAVFDGAEQAADEAAGEPGADEDWARSDAATRAGELPAGHGPTAGTGDSDPAEGDSDDPVEMLARGARFLSRRLSRLMRGAERGGQISKQEIDNLTAIMRMMERWETLAKERAKEKEADRDAKIAEAFKTINRRILRLAREEAERLVAAGYQPGDRGGGER